MSIDKRRFPRANISCKISTIFGERLLVFSSHTENIGVGGIMSILEEKLRISTVVNLELLLPNREKPLKCKGQVAWVREINPQEINPRFFNTGIEIIDISDSNQAEISKFVDTLISEGQGDKR